MQHVTVVTALDAAQQQRPRFEEHDEWAARARLPRWADARADRGAARDASEAGAPRTADLLAALAAVGTAVVLFDPAGRVAEAPPVVDRLLAPDAERSAVWQAARTLAAEARRVAAAQRAAWPNASATRVVEREVTTAAGTYRLVAAVPGSTWAAVVVERRAAPAADDGWLRASCGLSARECQVARLLAEGRTTGAVAAVLGISPHTARHHTERVYEKLGVRSRAALGTLVGVGRGGFPAPFVPALRAALATLLVALLGHRADLHAQAAPPPPAPARRPLDAAVTLKVSTLGVGLEVGKLLGSHAALRVGGYAASYNRGATRDAGRPSTYGLSLRNASGMLDLFPGRRGAFRASVGVVGGTTALTADGRKTLAQDDGGSGGPFAGTLSERVTYPSARPYVGLGWGTPAARRGGLGLVTDLGVLYGKPTYTLVAVGPGASAPAVQRAVERQRADLRADVEKYGQFYPVVGLGLAYRF